MRIRPRPDSSSRVGRLIARVAAAVLVSVLARATASAQAYTVLHEFSARAGNPLGGLIQAADGKLYGTLSAGGAAGLGSVYSLTPDGMGGYSYAEVYGATPADQVEIFSSGLLEAADGGLYGATYFPQGGVIYRVDPAGTFSVVHTLTGNEGAYPSQLIQLADGNFYGVASLSGTGNGGTAFRMDTAGNLTVIHSFVPGEGTNPVGPLLLGSDGFLYGECESGGGSSRGTIFRMNPSGSVTVLYTFTGPDGSNPVGGLIEGTDGFLYGTTSGGGAGQGTVFRISTSGALTILHALAANEGSTPLARLLQASDGNLYGTTWTDASTLFRVDTAGNFATLHTFSSAEGSALQGTLIEVGGQLVGTAYFGGASGYGTAFTATLQGNVSVAYSFAGPLEGEFPAAGLIEASDGFLYGTASGGGASGSGTLWKVDTAGTVTLLHAFDRSTDGANPEASLIQASDGKLYGTATSGGAAGHGTVFRSDTAGALTTLHAFSQSDGNFPWAPLIEASDGNFYGTTFDGGDTNQGTAFRIDGTGVFASLHSFSPVEGAYPFGLVQASDGAFYGNTNGAQFGPGSAFRMDSSGAVTPLHSWPEGVFSPTLLLGSDGNLYGANRLEVYRLDLAGNLTVVHAFQFSDYIDQPGELIEGSNGDLWGASLGPVGLYRGAVFRVHSNGDLTIAHRYAGLGPDGADPYGRPLLASDGMVYGTTTYGGQFEGGVVYRIDPASVIDVTGVAPGSGPAPGGSALTISGANFQPGATVTIGSVPATNVVVSAGQITATVPALAAGAAYDVVVSNPDLSSATHSRGWVADAADVPPSDLYYDDVTRLFRSGVSVGCGGGSYCVDESVTRAQMAVFLLKGKFGPYYAPPPATGTVFADVPADGFAAAFIEDLFHRGISAGCGNGNYCPDDPISRAEMAPLLLKTLLGPSYTPPPATGTVFGDVAAGDFAADFIEDIAARGITGGCSASPPLYCPTSPTTRGQMAAFVVATFGLP